MRKPAPPILLLNMLMLIFSRKAVTFPSRHGMEMFESVAVHTACIIINVVFFYFMMKALKRGEDLNGWKGMYIALLIADTVQIVFNVLFMVKVFM